MSERSPTHWIELAKKAASTGLTSEEEQALHDALQDQVSTPPSSTSPVASDKSFAKRYKNTDPNQNWGPDRSAGPDK